MELKARDSRRLLTIEELADRLQVPVRTVYAWRARGQGPRGVRVGKHVRFTEAEVATWVEAQSDARTGGAA